MKSLLLESLVHESPCDKKVDKNIKKKKRWKYNYDVVDVFYFIHRRPRRSLFKPFNCVSLLKALIKL